MHFASDNSGPAHPRVMAALIAANEGYAASYGDDPIMEDVRAQIRGIFEAPEAAVYLVINGTAANALLLSAMTKPWETIFCSECAHINEDECNAPEFYTGAKLTLVPTADGKMAPGGLRQKILGEENRGVHGPQRGPLSITQVTEKGTLYTLDEIRALTTIAREFGMQTHLDGARFANALTALESSPAEMTWKAGVDTVSFGGTKNGVLGVEACIIFNPEIAWEFELRRKRGGHLLSKHRYLSAQMQAYLTDGLWLDMARSANARCARLAAGLQGLRDLKTLFAPQANMIFFEMPRREHKRMLDAGAVYHLMNGDHEAGDPHEPLIGRLVCDWSMTEDSIDQFLDLLRG